MRALARSERFHPVEPGFLHLSVRELAALVLAYTIVLDWAAQRYLGRRRVGGR